MFKLRRQILAFLLLLTLMAPLGYPYALRIRQHLIRHRMEERMERSLRHTFRLPENDLAWVKKGKEIRLHDHLFDIHTLQRNPDGTVTVTGLYDEEETALTHALRERQREDGEQSGKMLLNALFSLQGLPQQAMDDGAGFREISVTPHGRHTPSLQYIHYPVPTPPPLC